MQMKLSTREVLMVNAALGALDGRPIGVKDGDLHRVILEPYKLGPGLRMAIAKNLQQLKAVVEAYENVRNGLIRQIGKGMSELKEDGDKAEFLSLDALLLSEVHEVVLTTIAERELHLDVNAIPGSVLSALLPIMDGIGPVPAGTSFKTAREVVTAPAPRANGAAELSA